jgi:pimeloyl-ACP methyl ester carboxylesterase
MFRLALPATAGSRVADLAGNAVISRLANRWREAYVVYVHGQWGGSCNRASTTLHSAEFQLIKNLVVDSDGLYLSPDFSDFGEKGAGEVAALISHYAEKSPGAPVFVACGSMGGGLCWEMAKNGGIPNLGGLLLLGSHWDDGFLNSAAFKRKVPVFLAQGSHDTVFDPARQEAFYHAIRQKSPGYPVRFVRFETGTHGTPIRMTDWREVLN